MKTLTGCLLIALSIVAWFYFGGSRLDYLHAEAPKKVEEICAGSSDVVYQGYQRTILRGFGGKVWYQCKIDGVWYEFNVVSRLLDKELAVYSFTQKTIFPNSFEIK